MNEKRAGILLSYALVAVNAVTGLLFTAVLLKHLGQIEYGLYKLAVSWMSMISVLEFGLGGTITRYVIKYKTEGDRQGERKFMGMAFVTYGALAGVILVVGSVLCAALPFFSQSIAPEQVRQFRILFMGLVGRNCILMFNHAYSGWFMASERFVYIKTCTLLNTVLRLALVFVLLPVAPSAVTVVALDLLLALTLLLCNMVARKVFSLEPVRFVGWDKALFREVFLFTSSIFLASVINQFNGNVDSIVLGMYSTTICVGLYSSVMQIYTVYCTLSTAVQEVFLPQVSRSVFAKKTDDEITRAIVTPSRMQLMVLGLALTGFVHLGYDFFALWLGDTYSPELLRQGYLVGVVVMAAALWQLFQNSATNILKAKNLLRGKVTITAVSTAVNFVLTVVLVPRYGMLGAAVGTAVSLIFGYGIATNIYYQKVAKLNLKLYYRETFSGFWLAIPLAFAAGFLLQWIPGSGFVMFCMKAGIYSVVYGAIMLLIGLNPQERKRFLRRR